METKTIKIGFGTYREVCEYAGELQKEWGEPVSLDKAISHLFQKKKLSDLAGSWKMSNREAEDFLKNIKRGWSSWKIKSA